MSKVIPFGAAAVLGLIGAAEIALDGAFSRTPGPPAAVLAAVLAGVVIAAWLPVTGTAVVATGFPVATVGGLDGPTGVVVLAFVLAPGWAGYRRPPRRSWAAPLAAQLMASLGTWIAGRAAGSTVSGLGAMAWENLFFGLLAWGAWGAGIVARRLRERADLLARLAAAQEAERIALEAERTARERTVVVEERQRIARDMHDAVAHSLSVMVLQLGAVRSTLPPGTPQGDMLLGVERLGRESVRELRALLGMLREEPDPTARPSLARLGDLVTEVRAAGLPVEMQIHGDVVSLPRALDASAYRVVQEALTNVLRHAGTVPTTVAVRRDAGRVTVVVENEPGAPAPVGPGGGHGLVGMRERVALFDGEFAASARPDGGFLVRAGFRVPA